MRCSAGHPEAEDQYERTLILRLQETIKGCTVSICPALGVHCICPALGVHCQYLSCFTDTSVSRTSQAPQ